MTSAKTSRWLDLIAFLLQHRFPVTREQIFESVRGYRATNSESARRTFERDKDELRALGLEIETLELKDAAGDEAAVGYRLHPIGLYLPYFLIEPDAGAAGRRRPIEKSRDAAVQPYPGLLTIQLTGDDVKVIDRSTRRLLRRHELPVVAAIESLRRKLGFDIPLPEAAVEQFLGMELPAEGRRALEVLQRAVTARSALACRYYSTSRSALEERVIEPWGLLFQRSHWYCVGKPRDRDSVRMFRVDRMRGARLLRGGVARFDVPKSFDVRQYVGKEPWQLGPEPATVVRLRLAFPESRRLQPGSGRRVSDYAADGSVEVEFEVRNVNAFVRWLLPFGEKATVLSPAQVQSELETLRNKLRGTYVT